MSAFAKLPGVAIEFEPLEVLQARMRAQTAATAPIARQVAVNALPAKKADGPRVKLERLRPDLLTAALPPPEFAWAPRIPRNGVTLLVGDDGLGKSFMCLQLALCGAAEKPFLGAPVKSGRWVFVTSEDRKTMMERRAQAILRAHFTPDEAARALANFEVFDVTDLDARLIYAAHGSVAFTDWTHALATQLGSVTGTILDPLARFVAGSENDAEVATHLIRAGEHIAAGTGGAVLITHHPNKASMRTGNVDGTEGRGSGGFRGGARSQLRLIALSASDASGIGNASRDTVAAGNLLALYHTKLNDGQKAPRALLTREADGTFRQFIPQTAEPREALHAWLTAQGKPLAMRAIRDAYREWSGTLSRDKAVTFAQGCVGNVIVAVDDKTPTRYVPGTIAEPAIDPFAI